MEYKNKGKRTYENIPQQKQFIEEHSIVGKTRSLVNISVG